MILALLLACTGAPPEDTARTPATAALCVGPSAVTWDNWGEDFFTTYCDACHSSRTPDRRGAPESAVFDTEAETIAQIARVRARVLEEETMPLGGGVFDDDLSLLRPWVECVE